MYTLVVGEHVRTSEDFWIKKNKRKLTAIAASVALASGGVGAHAAYKGHKDSKATPLELVVPNADHPQPQVDNSSRSFAGVVDALNSDLKESGHSTAIIEPDKNAKDFFARQYFNSTGLPFGEHPKLREIAIMHDKNVFKEKGLDVFDIYNASEKPLDLQFIRYALESTKLWLDKHKDEDILLGDRVSVKVAPDDRFHAFIVVDSIPKQLSGQTAGDALTWINDPNYTVSFINATELEADSFPDGSRQKMFTDPGLFFQYDKFAVEICQSLVRVKSAKKVPGGYGSASASNEYLQRINPGTEDEVLVAQESTCNGLGDVLTANYLSGAKGVKLVAGAPKNVVGIRRTPWKDYSLYTGDLADFSAIIEKNDNDPDFVNTIQGHKTPTLAYLHHLEHP